MVSTFHIFIFRSEYTDVNTAEFIFVFYVTDFVNKVLLEL
jgi:hypothetical protein